jgi:molybdopterin-biosynthesis enzyme MoeA-like protein
MCNDRQFGVIVTGAELLCGKRMDKHLPHVIQTLQARGMQVEWSRTVGDLQSRLVRELRSTQLDSLPVFCFGGIGATPDDKTREAAAEAFGTRLVRHPEAITMIEDRFGDSASPGRLRMADLPEDCLLIPNPHTGFPGFTLFDHHFFPGFTSMAWPMLDWVLDHYYSHKAPLEVEKSARVFHVHESALIQLMDELSASHVHARLFSLPHMAEIKTIELGFRGERDAVEAAFSELVTALTTRALEFEVLQQAVTTNAFRQIVV